MKRQFIILCLFFTWICQGCTQTEYTQSGASTFSPTTSATPMLILSQMPIITPTYSITPTVTSTPHFAPTLTFTPSLTSTVLPALAEGQMCFPILPTAPAGETYQGKIILVGDYIYYSDPPENGSLKYKEAYLFDLAFNEITEMPPGKILSVSVSPNRLRYAAKDATDNKIKIYSTQGQPVATLIPGEYPYSIDRWLDNQRVVFAIQEPIEGTSYLKYPRDEIVIDIFTGKQQLLLPDYPDIDLVNARMTWEGISTTKYDTSLTRVVYPSSITSDFQGENGNGYVLWDVVNKVKLAQMVTIDFGITPLWSPDESRFVINNALDGEFYTITREGEISLISHLNRTGEDGSLLERNYFSEKYSWSPDGKVLAFWLESYDNQNITANLAFLNTVTGEVTYTCLSAGYVELRVFYPLIWSPDGKSIVTIANWKENGDFDTLLVDLEGGFVFKILENLTPGGWLNASQK